MLKVILAILLLVFPPLAFAFGPVTWLPLASKAPNQTEAAQLTLTPQITDTPVPPTFEPPCPPTAAPPAPTPPSLAVRECVTATPRPTPIPVYSYTYAFTIGPFNEPIERISIDADYSAKTIITATFNTTQCPLFNLNSSLALCSNVPIGVPVDVVLVIPCHSANIQVVVAPTLAGDTRYQNSFYIYPPLGCVTPTPLPTATSFIKTATPGYSRFG